jgi:hypothetical protein
VPDPVPNASDSVFEATLSDIVHRVGQLADAMHSPSTQN